MEKLKNGRLTEKDNLAFICHWSNPPRTQPRKAKMQIALVLFRPCGFWLSRSCANEISGAYGLCFIFIFLFNITYAILKSKKINKTEAAGPSNFICTGSGQQKTARAK